MFAQDGIDSSDAGWGPRVHRLILKPSSDSAGGFFLPWTTPGQWLDFSVEAASSASFAPVVRVAPLFRHRHILLLLDGGDTIGETAIPDGKPGTWQDVELPSVRIAAGIHRIRIVFQDGGTAFHLVDFRLLSPGKPGPVVATDGYWPLHLRWSAGSGSASYDVYRRSTDGIGGFTGDTAFELVGSTADTFLVDAPSVSRVYGATSTSYVVVGRNGSFSSLPSDTSRIALHVAGWESLSPISPFGMRTPQGFLVQWARVPGALGYSVEFWQGTMGREGSTGTTDTFYLDPNPPTGRAYRIYPSNPYYRSPMFAGWVYAQ